MTPAAPTPAALDADRRRDEHSVSAILRRQQQRSEELRQRRQEALDRDRQAALEAARAQKVICGHCGSFTAYAENCTWCGQDPEGEAPCPDCSAFDPVDPVPARGAVRPARSTRLHTGPQPDCATCRNRRTVEPPCARLYELSVAALAELRRGADPALHRASGVRDAADVTPGADQSRGLDGAQGDLGVEEGA